MTQSDFFRLDNVSKRFGVVHALDRVSLAFRPGELLALVGENGAGKSTMMRILEGVFQPDGGTVHCEGAPVAFAEPRDSQKAGIRVIHQEPEIVPNLTVAENIFVGEMPRMAGLFLNWRTLEQQTNAVLKTFAMDRDMHPRQLCATLGPAQRQMVEIMRAVRAGGRLIAFDEPTSSLTDDEARRLFVVIRRLRAEGASIVYISHRLNEIIDIADRIVVLRDGRLVDDLPAAGATEQGIAKLMVGRDVADLFTRQSYDVREIVLEVDRLTTDKVKEVSLTVRKGEVLGIAGLMGAGRSELAKGIFGFDRRRSGRVLMNGVAIAPDSPQAAIVAGIGFAPEDRKHEALLLFRSILDNAALCVTDKTGRFGFFSRRRAMDIVAPLAAKMSIKAPSLDEEVSKLSGGNQQKVVLARWLARQPMLLILDEPTRGIDIGAKSEIYRLIGELATNGIGVILISSEMPELIGLADRILVMAEGGVTVELTRPNIDEASILHYAMPQTPLSPGEHVP